MRAHSAEPENFVSQGVAGFRFVREIGEQVDVRRARFLRAIFEVMAAGEVQVIALLEHAAVAGRLAVDGRSQRCRRTHRRNRAPSPTRLSVSGLAVGRHEPMKNRKQAGLERAIDAPPFRKYSGESVGSLKGG